jgi:hypothetical protein
MPGDSGDIPKRSRMAVHALAADGDVGRDDRPDLWPLAPDAEDYERGLLDAFDKNNATEAAGCRPL